MLRMGVRADDRFDFRLICAKETQNSTNFSCHFLMFSYIKDIVKSKNVLNSLQSRFKFKKTNFDTRSSKLNGTERLLVIRDK